MKSFTYPFLIFIFGILLFYNIFPLGFAFDDKLQIINNPYVHSLSKIPEIFNVSLRFFSDNNIYSYTYRPIFYSMYAVLYSLGNGSPFPFHLFQVSFHIINSILVFFSLSYFFKKPVGFALALVFLAHPVNEEVVAYIANIQDVLFFFFGMIAFLLLQRNKALNIKRTFLVATLLLLSIMSKETGIIFVFISALYLILFNRSQLKNFFIPVIPAIFLYFFMRLNASEVTFLNVTNKTVSIGDLSLFERLIISPKIVFFYIKDLAMPYPKLPDLNYLKSTDITLSIVPLSAVLIVFSVFIFIGLLIYKKFRNYLKLYLFFFILFILGILLHSQIIPLDVIIAKRWLYLPILGLLGLFGVIIKITEPFIPKPAKLAFQILFGFYLFILCFETMIMNNSWQ